METGGDDEIFKHKYNTSIMENQRFNNDNFINLMQLKKINDDTSSPPVFHAAKSKAEKTITSQSQQSVVPETKFNNNNNNNNNGGAVGNKNRDVGSTYYEAESDDGENSSEPSHHARRPMNAFLIFCKRHRAVVRQKFPSLENRAVTKILGEWWASLDEPDKESYTALAKQYKDAFFNANPNFKWYKLPAPPLRTLHTRPGNVPRQLAVNVDVSETNQTPEASPSKQSDIGKWTNTNANSLSLSGFTPGKLADETQLGNLCSLIDPNYHSPTEETPNHNNNNLNINNNDQLTPTKSQSQNTSPFDSNKRQKSASSSSTSSSSSLYKNAMGTMTESKPLTFTNLRNHVALSNSIDNSQTKINSSTSSDSDCPNRSMVSHSDDDEDDDEDDFNHKKFSKSARLNTKGHLVRKSGRSCKGKRYAEFMTEGRLAAIKHRRSKDFPNEISPPETFPETSSPSDDILTTSPPEIPFRKRTVSNGSDDSVTRKMFRAADFNLDEKIEALPSLSLEKFQQRKRENKKRKKFVSKHHTVHASGMLPKKYVKKSVNNNEAISASVGETKSLMKGSRKRKARKTSITHLEPLETIRSEETLPNVDPPSSSSIDLCDLATLAEVAVKLSNNNNS